MAIKRFNASVLGPVERPALAWLAAHMPDWVVPDHLTLLGACGALLCAAGFVMSRWSLPWLWLASLGLVVNWIGDSVDGTLARRRQIERPRYGFFVDHTSDLFAQVAIFLAIGLSPCAHFGVACLGLIAFLMGFVYTLIGAHANATMRITYFGFGPTEIRALLIFGNCMVLAFGVQYVPLALLPSPTGDPLTTHDLVILTLALSGVVLIGSIALRDGAALARLDPPPARPPGGRPPP